MEAAQADPSWKVAPASFASRVVLVDTVLFSLFALDRVAVGPLPFGVALCLLIGFVALCRTPKRVLRSGALLLVVYAGMLGYLACISSMHDTDWHNRLLRFAIIGLLAWALAERRMDPFSAIFGVSVGLIGNAVMFYAGLTPNRYPPYLTGFLGDKNVAGLWYALFAILGLYLWKGARAKIAWLALFGFLVFQTGSRTSISATLLALLWCLLRNRLGPTFRVLLAGGMVFALGFAEERFARIGVFADRSGTDWFREQIDHAVAAKLQITPWYGLGLGEARVVLDGGRAQFFHNSFDALRVEGGWPLLILWMLVLVVIAGGLFRGTLASTEKLFAEAGVIVVMVCAWKLGEVFFTSAGFIALGLALGANRWVPRDEVPLRMEGA